MNLGQDPVPRPLAVVLVSGGMDSLVCAAIAARTHEPAFLHLNYGQRTEKKELSCFTAIAHHYRVRRRLVIDASHLAAVGLDLVKTVIAANAARVGAHFMRGLGELARDYPCIGEVRGKGLMIGMELIANDAERTPARALCDAVVNRAYHNGLILLTCGTSTVRFMPPLSVNEAEVDEALGLLRSSLDEALKG